MFFNESYTGARLDVQASETGLSGDEAGMYRMLAETGEQWYNLREKMMKLEHVAIIREDAQLLSEGTSSFFSKISSAFKTMLAKVKEIWKKFCVAINSMVMSDKDFIKKYEKELNNKSFAGFETKGRKWITGTLTQHLDFQGVVNVAVKAMDQINSTADNDAVTKLREHYEGEKFEQEVHGIILKGGGSMDSSEFAEGIRKSFFTNGDDEAEDLEMKDLSLSTMMEIVKNAAKNIESVSKGQEALEKLLESIAKFYDKISKELTDPEAFKGTPARASSNEADHSTTSVYTVNAHRDAQTTGKGEHSYSADAMDAGGIAYGRKVDKDGKEGNNSRRVSKRTAATIVAAGVRRASSIASSAFGMCLTATKDRRNEYKSILARMITYKPKKVNESYSFGYEGSDILDNF